jgi:amino acid adenylation domain-containing protein
MNNLNKRIASLSPAKRALLEQRLTKKDALVSEEQQGIPRRSTSEPCPLSFAQQRLWFLDQFEPNNPFYNLPKAIHMKGALNMEALRKSLDAIVARHESLRTTIDSVDGKPIQVISENRALDLSLIDLSESPRAEREKEMQRLLKEESQRPFNLSQDLMLRAALLRLGQEEHVLFLVMHHIASDGWSMAVLSKELTELYESFVTGKPSPLPELPIQYADFSVWQRNWLQGEVLETQFSYWKNQLDGAPPLLELPTDRPRPAIQTYRGSKESVVLTTDLSEALKALSQREGVTLFMTLLAVFKTLLYRYIGQEDIVVGSPIANRTRVETESLIGFFVNTLALRTDLSGNPSFRELLGRVRDVAFGAYAHQDFPFEKLVAELQPERNMRYSPFLQVMFVLQNAPRNPLELSDLTLTPLEFDHETAKFDLAFDLALEMVEKPEGLSCSLWHNADLFDAATIFRMLGHYQTLLEGIVTNPDQRIGDLPLLTAAERHQLLVEWNDTRADYPKDCCIHQLFEAQAEQTPDAIAVVFEDQQLTYRELNARANQLAHHLRKLGVGPEVLVGICLERSLEMVVGLLGILKAGGAYVPLDPTYPRERLAFMLSDSKASVLLTQEKLAAELSEPRLSMVCLDTNWQAISQESRERPVGAVTSENLAYVIYTSGTTGSPKGVLVAHQGLCNLIESHIRTYQVQQSSRVLHVVSFSFDAAAAHMFLALCSGSTLCLARDSLLPGSGMIQILRDQSITHALLPASVLAALPFEKLPLLRVISVGAGICPPDLVARWAQGRRFLNVYGPTEATIASTVAECTGGDRRPPIGRPIANTQIYILDRHLQPVPIGVPGELHIGGVGLARGYLNRAKLTAEKFIPNPFSGEPGARLYKTGDLARYLPDGNIDFLGRIDHQVKLRGLRIELEEIEAVLNQHPTVQESVVLMREDKPGDKRLVAYIVTVREKTLMIGELRSFLKVKLPDYMVPSAFVMLDMLPLTPNGKVDRGALPAPDWAKPEVERAFVALQTPMQSRIAEVWQEALGVERVGVYDNFFDLGGHSLLLIQVIARLEKRLGVRANPSEFIAQTLGQLASSYEEKVRIARHSKPESSARKLWRAMKRAIFHRSRALGS